MYLVSVDPTEMDGSKVAKNEAILFLVTSTKKIEAQKMEWTGHLSTAIYLLVI